MKKLDQKSLVKGMKETNHLLEDIQDERLIEKGKEKKDKKAKETELKIVRITPFEPLVNHISL